MDVDESDLPDLPAQTRGTAGAPHVPRHPGVGVGIRASVSRANSGRSSGTSAGGKRVGGVAIPSGSASKRSMSASTLSKHSKHSGSNRSTPSQDQSSLGRPLWGANVKSAKPATSSSTRGASLSLLKREAAERRTRQLHNVDTRHEKELDRRETNNDDGVKKRGKRNANASVYNRLLRESQRSARVMKHQPSVKTFGKTTDVNSKENDENTALRDTNPFPLNSEVSHTGGGNGNSRRKNTGHTTTEDEGGGYWATTEPDDGGTSGANDWEDNTLEVTSHRAWLNAGGVREASCTALNDVSETRNQATLREATNVGDENESGSESEASSSPEQVSPSSSSSSQISKGSSTHIADVTSPCSNAGETSVAQVTLSDSRPQRSEDEAPVDEEMSDDNSHSDASDHESESDASFSSETHSVSLGSEDSFASASLDPESLDGKDHSDAATSDSARLDPNPDDVDVAFALREDNAVLRAKLRQAADALSLSAKERTKSAETQARLNAELETKNLELEKLRRELGRREKWLEKTQSKLENAESEAKYAFDEASTSLQSAKASEKRAKDFEKRALSAIKLQESAELNQASAEQQSSKLVKDLERANEALLQMTEAAEEARAEAKAALVWRVARGESSGQPTNDQATDRSQDTSAAEHTARALACAVAEAEQILNAGPEGVDPLDPRTPTKPGDDFGAARSLVSAARHTQVDAQMRLQELKALRTALTGEMAAARRAEREMHKLRSRTHDLEAEAHTLWQALDVERSKVATSTLSDDDTTVTHQTPIGGKQTAFDLLSLVSPSLTYSPRRVAMESELQGLDKVVAHLNKQKGRSAIGFAALDAVGKGDDRRVAFFCFKFWQQLAAISGVTPIAAKSTLPVKSPSGTPVQSISGGDEFAFDVKQALGDGEKNETQKPTNDPSPPHLPLPLPRWLPTLEAPTQNSESPNMIDLNTPPLERWAKRT